jgi:hypothetical protein
MGDWGYAEQRIFSYTIELATTFIPQESQVEQICENNLQAALIMLDRVNHSTITGLITDENEEPLIVEVYVTEIDSVSGMTSVEPFRSGNSFGRYYRLLLPGEYAFTFHKENYADIIKSNVTISEDSNTELDICLKPEFINSQDINIFVESDFINLQCENEADYNYEIYSSSNPYTNFELNITGEFVNDSQWKEVISDNQKFFMIKRISAE